MFEFFIVILQFLSGSMMYSYLLGKICGVDIRVLGDGNPGVSNLWKMKGWKFGVIGLFLDFSKGFFPVILFKDHLNYWVYIIALSFSVLGHAFSPFLNFKGGKAITTSFGVWTAATIWKAPIIMGSVLVILKTIFKNKKSSDFDFLIFLFGFLSLIPYIMYEKSLYLYYLYFFNFFVVILKHRKEIKNIWRDLLGRI
jgi:acyl-phosphate glycerol 3-phosphate acyltransferase